MKTPVQQDLIAALSDVLDLNPDIRLGQLIAFMGDLGQLEFEYHLGDLEDEQLLTVLERHRANLLATGRMLPQLPESTSVPLLTETP
jgi:hypothetical protein